MKRKKVTLATAMRYSQLKTLKPAEFRRYSGIKPETFERLANDLRPHLPKMGQRGGQPGFEAEDQLLITLEYWREYRTQFHLGVDWGTSEATICRTIKRVEDQLAALGYASLPGKKALKAGEDLEERLVAIDVSESPIERPKKNKEITTAARKVDTRLVCR